MLQTRITKLFGIKHPLILPGMSWISTPELVAAVSNAGGLGILATGPLNAEQTRSSIRRVRELTKQPFGVGATLLMPGAKENAEVALEERVPVINYSLGKGEWIATAAHAYGGKVMATVVSDKHARSAAAAGADALMVTGHEAAAHGGDVTSMVLVPTIAARAALPLVAAGGFATGGGLLAALALGADGVAMGSRFAVSKESPLHSAVKDRVVELSEADTIYSKNFDGLWARVMKTPAASRACAKPTGALAAALTSVRAARRMGMPLWKVAPALATQWDKMYTLALFGAATEAIQAATVDGNLQDGVQFIGQVQGLINQVLSAEEIVQLVMAEARDAHVRNSRAFSADESLATSDSEHTHEKVA
eukprot:TRINITY_DN3444_c0_g1_i1.p1 TRINITY_DN3444_c0_g1~~TRINITY_DN3444_c0_g1_i1.p1  ORF type:complete len:388 (-),score=141.84 TRINITY_DN3444_c0_g1_i1:320-1411(-)